MKKSLILFCMLLVLDQAFAQPPAGGVPGGRPAGGPASGHLYGKLTDSAGHGIGRASVLILRTVTDPATGMRKEVLLKGLTSQNNGDFSAEDLPVLPINNPLKLSVSAIGYTAIVQQVILTPQGAEKDLGNLQMMPATKELQQVVVTASQPTMTVDMEKKVFNVSKDIVSVGGNGLDVLKNVPGVNVDIDGNVTLRGGSPQLFVDGKPTTLTLDEIPSDAIGSIEVITNPSARYDASGGGAGILNIVLKKNRKHGYNGSVRVNTDSHGGTGLGAGLNFRENKINVSADVNSRTIRDWMSGSTGRTTLGSAPDTYIGQQELDTTRGGMIFGRIGLDFFMTNRTTLSLTGFAMHNSTHSTSAISMTTDSLYPGGTVTQYTREHIDAPRSFDAMGATLGMKHLFAKDKEEWTADASFFSGRPINNSLYTTNEYEDKAESTLVSSQLQKIRGSGTERNIILQTDFTDPLTSKMTLETGLRAAIQERHDINNNYTYDPGSAAYLLVPSAAGNYGSRSEVYAAYATLSSSIGNFTCKIGLRAESSNYHGMLLNSGQTFGNQYPTSLFPSLFFSQKLGGDQELQLSYTRRVNRPDFLQLVPYTDSSNKLNITRGNPDLVPEFTQSAELTYMKNFPGRNTLMGSVYYKHTDHLITNYIVADTDYTTGAATLINTFSNASSGNSAGAELTTQNTLTKWWDLTANINVYHSEINAGNEPGLPRLALWSWFGKANSSFRLPSGFSLQVSGMYQSKTNLPVNTNGNQPGHPNMMSQNASQGYIRSFFEVDLGVKKTLLANKITLALSFNDIFKSRIQDQYSYSEYFVQDNRRIRNAQLLRFNFTYNFGKVDDNLFHRKNNNMANESE
jgi:ferric enterobactin receptor